MSRYIYIVFVVFVFNCNNERILQLPEIEKAEVTEIMDVSPAYIFYDETQLDSTIFNRKNLIGTTNWLVNVDKRLTLKQAIPHIQYLQEKRKKASMHKNENAKNYFTCNDTSIGDLGFVEFTDLSYDFSEIEKKGTGFLISSTTEIDEQLSSNTKLLKLSLKIDNSNKTTFFKELLSLINLIETSNEWEKDITSKSFLFVLYFSNQLSFQDYISIKSVILKSKIESVQFSSEEFIY